MKLQVNWDQITRPKNFHEGGGGGGGGRMGGSLSQIRVSFHDPARWGTGRYCHRTGKWALLLSPSH